MCLAGTVGFEPTTFGFASRRSIQAEPRPSQTHLRFSPTLLPGIDEAALWGARRRPMRSGTTCRFWFGLSPRGESPVFAPDHQPRSVLVSLSISLRSTFSTSWSGLRAKKNPRRIAPAGVVWPGPLFDLGLYTPVSISRPRTATTPRSLWRSRCCWSRRWKKVLVMFSI